MTAGNTIPDLRAALERLEAVSPRKTTVTFARFNSDVAHVLRAYMPVREDSPIWALEGLPWQLDDTLDRGVVRLYNADDEIVRELNIYPPRASTIVDVGDLSV